MRARITRMVMVSVCYLAASVTSGMTGCGLANVLKVPLPVGVSGNANLANQAGAEASYAGAQANLYNAIDGGGGLVQETELLSDEFSWAAFSNSYTAGQANMDARMTAEFGQFSEPGDYPWQNVLQARGSLVNVLPELQKYEVGSSLSNIGEAYALIGYAEIFVAESYCDGTPLSSIPPNGGVQYGMPNADSALFRLAELDFDSAIVYSAGNDAIAGLANVGLGRALTDRGLYDSAALAVASVPVSFVYNTQLPPNYSFNDVGSPNLYAINTFNGNLSYYNVSDREGINGLDFISAHDPRLTYDTAFQTLDGNTWYFPNKFNVNLANVPLATGLEAELIQAEAALHDGNTGTWLQDLNALRNNGCSYTGGDTVCTLGSGQVAGQTAGLPPLQDPGSDTARVSLMFRERAFWLFGTGSRLGDLRRLVRQYQRDQSQVYPTGAYANGSNPNLPSPIPTYGTDVNLTLPTSANTFFEESNPHYKGCISSTKTA